MKYPCELVQDLLPLYIDEVCSEESKKAVEEHLSECPDCRAVYAEMRDSDEIELTPSLANRERQKAESYQSVKKKLFRKQLLAAVGAVFALAILVFAAIGILKNTQQVVEYNKISVSIADGDLIGRLRGSEVSYLKIKRVSTTVVGEEKDVLLFYVSDTKWNELINSEKVFSEFTLCAADKGSDDISAVYYFTGDYTNLENMSETEFQNTILSSQLLWEK
ncbi:zf-HC2 domain-containing protein [Murimonas intestini]|uniref:Anti-sigma-W factor RsiW n=1 Tax=Murimonas intestini TaxID=1337051 RepID=A0AB73T0P3_9FIRM|nr:zf-HC2 domain-containing protein [Murimonas intestini]MCR1842368.1 zf-HC2 domain-containing protein [Murimonas intestini]MCR1867709.1 zf-HC2 domain-containing protein [Murimonas intestini]MCR1885979.1 zf-HC2 domain-containing protein [Murimonas intestini]